MTAHEVTFIIHSNIDPAQLLDIAMDYGSLFVEEIESYGEEATFRPEEVSVEDKTNLYGGGQ